MAKGLEDLEVLSEAQVISDELWNRVLKWERLARDVVGEQLVRAADSVGANIAEAFGRYHYADKIRFLYYARGSVFETRYWIGRARARQLMSDTDFAHLDGQLAVVAQKLNAFVRSLRAQSRQDKDGASRVVRELGGHPYAVTNPIQLHHLILDEDGLISNP
ncbi:MAG TPA: four helix bundle protein [Anaerolineales bacterium]|nr:four helix bundle protein [Anaerolineales bacterium]